VKITRLIVTHSHPDHVGLAGWIVERFNCPLFMSQVEYLQSVYHQNRGTEERRNAQRLFLRRHGMDEDLTDKLLGRGQDYLKRVSTLPPSYHRISHGDEISIGTRRFKVITGGGHALDQVTLYCAADKLFLSADQVLSKISPNVSVWAVEPEQNSLGEYLASLASLTTTLPYDVLVLPGHGVPFYGLKIRIKQLADHHEERCRLIADACRESAKTSKELVPVVFHKHVLDAHQMGFAAAELIAMSITCWSRVASRPSWPRACFSSGPPEAEIPRFRPSASLANSTERGALFRSSQIGAIGTGVLVWYSGALPARP
jgi:glyoxylase-like metal-dependent hydrolase (beta-lactamase superfamily II)